MTPPPSPYQQFLKRQVGRILMRGGSDADVATYLKHAEGLPLRDVIEAPKDPDAQIPMPGMLLGLSMSALQGLAGLGDEAISGLVGLATLATGGGSELAANRITQTQEGFREQRTAFRQANKKKAIAAEIVGSLPLALGAAPIKAAGLLRTGARIAGLGAVAGAATGAGEADGPLSERAKQALFGGAAGLLLAPLVAGGVHVGGAGLKGAISLLGRWSTALGERGAGIGASRARELAARAIAQEGTTIDQLILKAQQAQAQGIPTSLADIAGDEVMALAVAAQGIRGEAKRQLADELGGRSADQGARMLGNLYGRLFRGTRVGSKNAYDAVEEIQTQMRAQAKPFYERSFAEEMVPVTGAIARGLNHPVFQDAYLVGRELMDNADRAGVGHGLPVPPLFQKGALRSGEMATAMKGSPQGVEVTGVRATPPAPGTGVPTRAFKPGAEGDEGLVIPDQLPVRALDAMKRGLDVVINRTGQEGKPAIDHELARQLRTLLGQLLAEADQHAPLYAAGRKLWSGEMDALEAIARGKGGRRLYWGQEVVTPPFHKRPTALVEQELADLAPQHRPLYKLGAFQDYAEAINGQTGEAPNIARQFFGGRAHGTIERDAEKRVRLLFDDPNAAQDWMDAVRAEARLVEAGARQAAPTKPAGVAPGELAGGRTVMRRQVGTTIVGMVQSGLDRAKAGWSEEISDEVANLFTKGLRDPNELLALLTSLRPYERGIRAQAGRRAVTAVVVGTQAVPARQR